MWLSEDEKFFNRDPKLPTTDEELLSFIEHLQSQRHALLRNEPFLFVVKPPRFDILHRWTCALRRDQITDRGYRAALNPLLFEAFTEEAAVRPELHLTSPLHTGEDKWGQVWKAKIRYEGAEADVAIKLYIQSLFPLPEEPLQVQRGSWATSPQQARNEAWSYAQMHSLQGQLV